MRNLTTKTLILLAALLVVLVAAGCGSKTAAVVNGKVITEQEINEQLSRIKNQQPDAFKGAKGQQLEKDFRRGILDSLINAELVKQEAARRGLKADNKEVNAKIDQALRLLGSEQKFDDALKSAGLTRKTYEQRVRDQIISEKLVQQVIADVKVSDKDVKRYYEENKQAFREPAQIRVSHIVSKTEKKAKEVVEKLDSGEDFAALAKAESIDVGSKDNGGDIGLIPRDRYPQNVLAAIDKLDIGEVSGIIKTNAGWEVFKLEEKKEARDKGFDEVKEEARQQLLGRKKQAKFQAFLADLKKKAKITKYDS